MIEVKVIADSISPDGVRLTTIEGTLHRFVLAELNTHGILARSAQSSRAVPVPKMLEMVRENPALPVFWGANKPGMSADEECTNLVQQSVTERVSRESFWKSAAYSAAFYAQMLHEAGYHKQIVNRIIEPFMWQRVVITGTEWENFENLRIHPAAQPEICAFAREVKKARDESVPTLLNHGEWHLPYVTRTPLTRQYGVSDSGEDIPSLEVAKKYSAARCATTSFRKEGVTLERAVYGTDGRPSIFSQLVEGDLPHCFDDQTEVLTENGFKFWKELSGSEKLASVDEKANFKGFKHPYKWVAEKYSGDMHVCNTKLHSSSVTPGHRVLYKYRKNGSIKSDFTVSLSEDVKNRPIYIPLKPTLRCYDNQTKDYYFGMLHGFSLGDGFVNKDRKTNLLFRFKKDRKINTLCSLLEKLDFSYTKKTYSDGVTEITVSSKYPEVNHIVNSLYDENRVKCMPEGYLLLSVNYQAGLYQGLAESDGTVKRSKYKFSSTSKSLAEGFYNLSIVLGKASPFLYTENKSSPEHYIVTNREREYALVNDPRKLNSSITSEKYDGTVYCASIEDGFLIVRRNGHVWISGNSVPCEHVARPLMRPQSGGFVDDDLTTHVTRDGWCWSGRFRGWGQFRKEITGATLTK